ncbi:MULTISPECIES: alpha/beta hydrolase [Cyanophyceae]|uniref:alpha/beta hydrolase n=1 Tax=Cyanophyceae TaxID=3028117 RepID=UPI0018EFCC90|nr:alpha/beta hydrolase [Trichocoleus sp. FACHB-40]
MASSPRQDRATSQPLHSFKQQNSPAGHKKNRSWLQKMRSPKGTTPVSRFFFSLCLGILSTALSAIPAFGAERIAFFYPPFGEFYISIKDLEIFAKEGKITPEFAFYANRVKPQQLAVLRELLQRRLDVGPITISQFTYTPIGEQILRRLGQVLKPTFRRFWNRTIIFLMYESIKD